MTEDIQYISEEQYQKFIDCIPQLNLQLMSHEDVRLMFQVIYEGALRVSEVVKGDSSPGLTPNDLDLDNKRIILRFAKGGRKFCKCIVKQAIETPPNAFSNNGVQYRKMFIRVPDKNCKKCEGKGKYRVKEFAWVSPETFDKLAKLAESKKKDERLFNTDRRQVWAWTKTLGELAGINLQHEEKNTTNLFPHALRHSRPIHLLRTGNFSINEIMTKLRHKSLHPTTTYVTVSAKSIQAKEFES